MFSFAEESAVAPVRFNS